MKLEYTTEITHQEGTVIAPLPDEANKKAEKLNGVKCAVTIESLNSKSARQNKAFHSLLGCFWRSGCSSFNSYPEMKDHYKLAVDHIAWTRYVYMAGEGLKYVTSIKDLPKGVKSYSIHIPASWSTISTDKAMQAITQLINDMHEAGVPSSSQAYKFEEIVQGMSQE